MQKCLNREHAYNVKCLKEEPIYWLVVVFWIIAPIVFITIGYYCIGQWACSNGAASILLGVGASIVMSIILFCIIPYVIGISLNMCYTYDWSRDVLPRTIKVKKPITSKRIPPNELPPEHAFVSYNDFTHANPLKSKRSQNPPKS
jgi:hypothetical protein